MKSSELAFFIIFFLLFLLVVWGIIAIQLANDDATDNTTFGQGNNITIETQSPILEQHNSIYYSVMPSEQCKGHTLSDMEERLPSTGVSMLPSMDSTTYPYVVKYNSSRAIVPGDIVVSTNFTHRVLGVYTDYLVTKGDNNQYYDYPYINESNVAYIVCALVKT